MKYRELDLNLLMALDNLVQLRSVSRAADKMAVTQSAMSNMLGRLRDYFDDPLLVQIGRRMEPTARGLELAEPVRDILVRIEATVRGPSEYDPFTSTRSFTLMVSDYSLMTVIPEFVQLVAKEAPRVRLNFTPQVMSPGIQIEQGGADLVIAPAMYCTVDHPSETLLSDRMVCVLDRDNPAQHNFDLATLQSLEHVVMQPPSDFESYSIYALAGVGISMETAIRSYSFASLPALVRGTNRVAVVQTHLARALASNGNFVTLPAPVDLEPLEQRMMWHKLQSPDTGIIWLRKKILEAARCLEASISQ